MSRPIRSLIISDYRLFIEGLSDLVGSRDEFEITGLITRPEDIQDVLAQIGSLPFDVILLDAKMERADALEVARDIKRARPEARLIVLGLEARDEVIVEFIEAGAVGYVLKDESPDELFNAIAAIHDGKSLCSSRLAASVFNRIVQLSRKQRLAQAIQQVSLTSREKDILRLMSADLCNKDIASHLNIALYTVKNHVHNILEKLQMRSRKEAVRYAFEKGLIEDPGTVIPGVGFSAGLGGEPGRRVETQITSSAGPINKTLKAAS